MTGIPLRGPPTPIKPRLYLCIAQSQHVTALSYDISVQAWKNSDKCLYSAAQPAALVMLTGTVFAPALAAGKATTLLS